MADTQTNFLSIVGDIRFVMNSVTKFTMLLYDLDEKITLNICGGVPCPFIHSIFHTVDLKSETNCFVAAVDSSVHRVERKIFYLERLVINSLMKVFYTGKGAGKNIFINEVIELKKQGYRYMTVSAAQGDGWNGYYTWARFGYSMEEPDHETFLELMELHGRKESSIIELMQTAEGRNFWLENGFWWEGYFDLTELSENMIAFQNYLTESGINISL